MSESTSHYRRVAVIVPVLRDAEPLEQLIGDLTAQTHPPAEIIVVSGTRDEHVAAIASRENLRLIDCAPSRGRQLDAGAAAATSDVLWFVHADARLPPQACAEMLDAMDRGAAGGCLRFVFDGTRSIRKHILERLIRLRIALGGMAYGDQALFCSREAYTQSGGFPHQPLFEEVPLVRHLRRQRRFAALTTPVFVSSRRWERDGWLRRTLHNRWLAMRHSLGASHEALARSYRQQPVKCGTPADDHKTTETHQ